MNQNKIQAEGYGTGYSWLYVYILYMSLSIPNALEYKYKEYEVQACKQIFHKKVKVKLLTVTNLKVMKLNSEGDVDSII